MRDESPWVMNLIGMASGAGIPARDAAIRALWVNHGFTVEEIHEVCSVDLGVIRWALLHAPTIRTD
jgi:ribosomal protein S11